MSEIDSRLLDCSSQPELTENFNRLIVLIDALESRIAALETPAEGN